MFQRCLTVLLLLTVCPFVPAGEPAAATTSDVPFARRLWAVTELVFENHVRPPARQEMLLGAVRGYLAKLGKPAPQDLARRMSALTTPEAFDALVKEFVPAKADPAAEQAAFAGLVAALPGNARLLDAEMLKMNAVLENNNYVGVGIQIRQGEKDKLAEIVVPFPGGPYRRAGGRTHDLIVEVDGKNMAGHSLQEVVRALRGEEGTAVTVLARQPGAAETRFLKMVREVIPFQSALGYRRVSEEAFDFHADPALPVAYVRLTSMTSSTYHELRRLERQLRSGGYQALVLDLRTTSAGAVVHAAQVADALLDGGTMWKVRDAQGRVKEYKADRDCLFRDWPLVVLVGEHTPDTPAVIAAALQDRGRAVLVGTPTAAGGTVRGLVPLPDGVSAVELLAGSVERLKPAKEPGVTPDHVVRMGEKQWPDVEAWQVAQERPESPEVSPPQDPQLAKALDLMRDALKERKPKAAG